MSMTAHQEVKKDEIVGYLNAGQKRIILKGSAGVGKTWLVKELVEWYVRNHKFGQHSRWAAEAAYITAPTNKALSILQSKIPANGRLDFRTIHSALKLRRDINAKTGKVRFVPSYGEKGGAFDGCKICFLDETSMLNTELLDMLDDYQFPIIFIGDDKQLNPVGEPYSPVFHRGYPEVELTEIIRQGEGNPIIELSRNLDLIKTRQSNMINGMGYLFENDRTKLIENLAEVNGTDELKYLAWTNLEVDTMNKRVRQRLYGHNPAKIEQGETLVFNAPKGEIWTNKEVKVYDLKIVAKEVMIPTAYSKYQDNWPDAVDKLKMKVYRVNNEFDIVHEHSEGMYKAVLGSLISNCMKLGWNWKGKFFFEEQFADTKYNHAISVHKSQGSTYDEAILNVGNIMYNKTEEERNRLMYTGVTRAAKTLILNNV